MQKLIMSNKKAVVKTTSLLPKDLVKAAKQYALDHETSVTAVIIEALGIFIQKKSKETGAK